MASPLGGRMSFEVSEALANITKLNKFIKENESQWRADASQMDDWSSTQEGLESRLKSLNAQIEDEKKKVKEAQRLKRAYIEQYGEQSGKVQEANDKIIRYSKELERSQKELKTTQSSLDKLNKELGDQTKQSDKAEKATKELNKEVEKSDKSFGIGTVAIGGFIANGLSAMVSAIGGAISSLAGLADSTLEYRREIAALTSVADQLGANGDAIVEKWMDVNSVINDEQSVTEGINNLMSAGFTAEKEMDAITKALEGASLQWKDTLRFEGLSDSLQEWIGSGGVNLTGQFAELLERLGYNLEDVTAQTKGMTDEQRRQWAITTLNKNGMSDLSDSYREANKDMIDLNRANMELTQAQANLGKAMTPMVASVKMAFADILYSFTDMVTGVEGGKEQFLYVLGNIAGNAVKSIHTMIQTIMPMVQEAIPQLLAFIQTQLPMVIQTGVDFISSLIQGASSMLPTLVTYTVDLVMLLVNTFAENSPAVFEAGFALLKEVVNAIPLIAMELLDAVPELINTIENVLFGGKNSIFNQAIDTLMEIVRSIPDIVKNLMAKLPDVINSILTFLLNNAPAIADGAFNLFMEIVKAIPKMLTNLASGLVDIIITIKDFFTSPENVSQLLEVGKNIIMGILNGFKNLGNAIWESIKGVGGQILDGAKKFFGIHSPSTVMAKEIGEPVVQGIEEGMKHESPNLYDTVVEIGSSIGGGFGDGFADAINGVEKEMTETVEDTLVDVGASVSKTAKEVGQTVANNTVNGVEKASKDYSGDISSVLSGLFEGDYSSMIDSAISAISKSSTVGSIFGGIFSFIKSALSDEDGELQGDLTQVAEGLINGLMNSFNELVDNLPAIIEGAIEFMRSFGIALIKAVPEIIKRIPEIIKSIVEGFLKEGIPALFDVGVQLIKGMFNGVKSVFSNIGNFFKDVGNGIVNGFKKIFRINSPSKVMADEVGKNLALGIEEGLTDNMKRVNSAIRNGVDTSVNLDQKVTGRKMVTVNQTNNYSQAHSRYELYKSRRDVANAVKLAMQGA